MNENLKTQMRGQLTDRIKVKSVKLLGYEISQSELRLMPYIQYVLMNNQRLQPQNLNKHEMKILSDFLNKGFILDGVTKCKGRPMMSEGAKLKVSKKFWNAMLEILWLSYVDLID